MCPHTGQHAPLSPLVLRTSGWNRVPSPPHTRGSSSGQPRAGDRGGGIPAKATWEACAKQGQDTTGSAGLHRVFWVVGPQSSKGRAAPPCPQLCSG